MSSGSLQTPESALAHHLGLPVAGSVPANNSASSPTTPTRAGNAVCYSFFWGQVVVFLVNSYLTIKPKGLASFPPPELPENISLMSF